MRIALLAALLTIVLPVAAHDDPPTYDRVSLQASASAEVDNDTLVAVVYAQREGVGIEPLVAEVNEAVRWAIERARAARGVKLQTLDYRSFPVHERQRLAGWRVRQALRLESRDAGALGNLLGELQERLAVESVNYQVSPQALREAEAGLTREALHAFSERARVVAEQLGAAGYRIVQVNLATGGTRPPPVMRTMAREVQSMAAAPPALEAGTRQVQVSADGIIELERR